MRKPLLVCMPLPTAVPISSSKYGKCHSLGHSTTPSSDMKKFETILPIGIASFGLRRATRARALTGPFQLETARRRLLTTSEHGRPTFAPPSARLGCDPLDVEGREH